MRSGNQNSAIAWCGYASAYHNNAYIISLIGLFDSLPPSYPIPHITGHAINGNEPYNDSTTRYMWLIWDGKTKTVDLVYDEWMPYTHFPQAINLLHLDKL